MDITRNRLVGEATDDWSYSIIIASVSECSRQVGDHAAEEEEWGNGFVICFSTS